MLDATTGRVLAITTLHVGEADTVYPSATVVDARTNRVFVGYGAANRMSVLDATTGKLLQTAIFANYNPPQPEPALPLGVDGHDHRVVVLAPNGLATVDEKTGGDTRYIKTPHAESEVGGGNGVVDGMRGRAMLSEGDVRDHEITHYIETVDLNNGRIIRSLIFGPMVGHLLVADERSERSLVFVSGSIKSPLPAYLTVLNEVTGDIAVTFPLGGGGATAQAAAIVNPITRHGLVLWENDEIMGPTRLAVVDLHSGKKLQDLPVQGVTMNAAPAIVADAPTHHVFITNASANTVTMLDGAQL
jgi:hypothetical protein